MLNFIERNFFVIVQRLGLLFAIIAFVATVVLGFISYEKINIAPSDKINPPVIKYSDYQNPISISKSDAVEKTVEQDIVKQQQADKLDIEFDNHVTQVIENLDKLPDDIINKTDMQQKIKILIKIKSNSYAKDLQVAYAKSLARLTKRLVTVAGDDINIDDFLTWHDKEFAKQIDKQTQENILNMSTIKAQKMTGFIILGMSAAALGIFIMFVMMLVMLRIERNTRG